MNGCLDGCFLVIAILFFVGIVGALATTPFVWMLLALFLLLFFAMMRESSTDS